MEKRIYGVLNADGTHTDISTSEKATKQYATKNKIDTISYRIGYNAFPYAVRKREWKKTKWFLLGVDGLTIYDNGGKSFDRITVVFNDRFRYHNGTKLYEAIGASETGAGFYQHTEAVKGIHLGKKINFNDLNDDLQKIILGEIC